MPLTELSRAQVFGGTQVTYEHASSATQGPMQFAVFTPAIPSGAGLMFLAGLTCSPENFSVKAGAQRVAADLGLSLIMPDTSPRGAAVPDDTAYDLGQGAGFYLDATVAPWAKHFRMETYVIRELIPLLHEEFGIAKGRLGLSGHSMGGHGALTLGLKYSDLFASVSAFAPVVAPTQVPWGQKAFAAYLGDDQSAWRRHCATSLVEDGARHPRELWVDQGTADTFLDAQLQPWRFRDACAVAGQPLRMEMREGYDHSYFYIASFVEAHLHWHAEGL